MPQVVARALTTQRPFRVPWSCLTLRVLGGDISPDMTLTALNGTLVGKRTRDYSLPALTNMFLFLYYRYFHLVPENFNLT